VTSSSFAPGDGIRVTSVNNAYTIHAVRGTCSLEQFGAKGDGVTDDYAAMTEALAAIGAGTYGALILGAKTYNLGAVAFTIPSGCLIRGQGWNSVLKTTFANTFLQVAANADNVHIEDCKLIGNSTGVTQRGIALGTSAALSAPKRATIRGVMIEAFGESGLLTWNGNAEGAHQGISVSNCFFKNCGIGYLLIAEYSVVASSTMTGCGIGLSVIGGNQRIIGCDISQNTDGIHFWGGGNDAHSAVVGCTLNHNTGNAVVIDGLVNALEFAGCMFYEASISVTALNALVTFSGCELAPKLITNNGGRLRFINCTGIDDYLVGVMESGNGWTEFVNGRGKSDTIPTWITSRVQRDVSFAADANKTLTAQESVAETLIVAAGTITASRQITNYFAPATKRKQKVVNNTAFDLTYAWFTGTSVTILTGKWAEIGSDGTNAIILSDPTNNAFVVDDVFGSVLQTIRFNLR
jgi:hypothetical protein